MLHVNFKNDNVAGLYHVKFPSSRVDFKKWSCLTSLSFWPHAAVTKVSVTLSNLRNSHVALSILEIKGH